MGLRSAKRRSYLAQPQGASTTSLNYSLNNASECFSGSSDTTRYNPSASLSKSSLPLSKPAPRFPPIRTAIKLVAVGDGGCGKTSLLTRFAKQSFPHEYVPTVFESYVKSLTLDGNEIDLALWDTAGQEEYDRLRVLSYPDTEVILLCYSVDNPVSLDNIYDRWLPEIQLYCPGVPYILVGTKADYKHRVSLNATPLIRDGLGQKVANSIKAQCHIECSAKTDINVDIVFEMAIKSACASKALAQQAAADSNARYDSTSLKDSNHSLKGYLPKRTKSSTELQEPTRSTLHTKSSKKSKSQPRHSKEDKRVVHTKPTVISKNTKKRHHCIIS